MLRLIHITGILMIATAGLHLRAQSDFTHIDIETYRLYMEQDWDSLISMGKEAIRQDVDYYYLRMRMGIALKEKKSYRKAATHFEHALRFNQGDQIALEYLYLARIFSGQAEAASLVREQFRGELALRLPPVKGSFVKEISTSYLYSAGSRKEELDIQEITSPGVQYVTRSFHNTSLSLVNRISPGFSLIHSFNFLAKTNEYVSFDGLTGYHTLEQQVLQAQYHISPKIVIPSGITFKPMLHILGIQYQTWVDDATGFQGGNTSMSMVNNRVTDFIAGMGFNTWKGPVEFQIGAYYGSINQARQFQNRVGMTWFPLGNLNLYTGGYLNTQFEKPEEEEGVVRFIPELMIGFAIAEKVWFDLNATAGEMTNYLENNGQIVFNSFSEVIQKKLGCSISVPVTDKGSLLFAGGRWTANRSEFYSTVQASNEFINPIHYNSISIYGGLSWKF